MKVSKRVWDILKFAITFAALAYLFLKMDMAAFIGNVVKTNPVAIIFAVLCVMFLMYIKVIRWRMLIGTGNAWFLLKSYFVGMFFGAFTPSKIGDFVRGFHIRKKYDLSLTRSMASVFYDRMLDLLCIFVYAAVSVLFLIFTGGGSVSLMLLLVVGLIGIAVSYFKLSWILSILMRLFTKITKKNIFKVPQAEIISEIQKISHKRKDIMFFSFVIWLINHVTWWIFAMLLGFYVDFVHFFTAINIATVIGLLPFTVGGFGARELSNVALLVMYGYDQNLAFLFTILSTTIGILVPAIVGAILNVKSKDLRY